MFQILCCVSTYMYTVDENICRKEISDGQYAVTKFGLQIVR